MKTDADIAHSIKLKRIESITRRLHIPPHHVIPYGRYIAKINPALLRDLEQNKDGNLILVTSMSPTPAGEGKTTLTIGLAQSLKLLKKKVIACIRQPSLGPFFGAKGGATGSGLSQVLPVEDITMHFTGDDHAVVSAHNLISSIIDNHIYHGNKLGINPDRILWKRVSDINDRTLRKIKIDLGGKCERQEDFYISAASELMSILCLSQDIQDLERRIEKILLAFDREGHLILLKDLKIQGAVTALLKNAIHPNLVQSIEGAPVFIHGGPFGNVSLGCSSLVATKTALKLADYVITEAGFATELGAEKFFDIKCRVGGLKPSAVVIVATLKALQLHGGAKDYEKLSPTPQSPPTKGGETNRETPVKRGENFVGIPSPMMGEETTKIPSLLVGEGQSLPPKSLSGGEGGLLEGGFKNLEKHIENIQRFGLPFLVAVNRFETDTDEELKEITHRLENKGIPAFISDVRNKGGKGGLDIAKGLINLCKARNNFNYLYLLELSIKEKIMTIAKEMYGADGAIFTEEAEKDIMVLEDSGYKNLPICVAKTPKSLSDNPALLGRPKNFKITVQQVLPAAGAGFLVAVCGNILLMPGFPEHPMAERIEVDEEGRIIGFI